MHAARTVSRSTRCSVRFPSLQSLRSSDSASILEHREDSVAGLQALLWTLATGLLVLSCAARSPATETNALPPLGASALVGCLAVLAIKALVALAPQLRRVALHTAKP